MPGPCSFGVPVWVVLKMPGHYYTYFVSQRKYHIFCEFDEDYGDGFI
jgi:hypothetical protein